jgi:hypothetical protein
MKILFVMASPEYLRFYDSTIRLLSERGHEVALAVNSSREKKPVGLEGMAALGEHVRVLGVAPAHEGTWGNVAYGLRGLTDFVRYLHPRFAEAPTLRARMKRKATPVAFRALDRIRSLSPEAVRRTVGVLTACERAIPPAREIVNFIRVQAPDAVLVSPLVDAASDQVDWIKGAQAAGVPSAVCVASWDNLTNKGLLRIEPDRVIVWNEAQKREAVEYHYIAPERVVTTGAQLFDRWFDRRVTRARNAFCEHVGLPDARPYLLFTGSSSFISESSAEVAFVRRWIAAVRGSGHPGIRDLGILVRPHPYNCHAWEQADLSEFDGVAVYPRRGYNPVDEATRADFFDSLYHSVAIVGINTSAMIEAAIVGRPVFSISASEFAGTQEGTLHFHHLLPENGGCVRIADSIDDHVRQLAERLRDPDAARAETQRFVGSFIRPCGVERPATPIVADAIEGVARLAPIQPVRPPVWAFALRPLILLVSAIAAVIGWLQGPSPLASARKRARHLVHRVGKQAHRARTMITDRPRTAVRKAWKRTIRGTRQRAEQARRARLTVTRRVRQVRHAVGEAVKDPQR